MTEEKKMPTFEARPTQFLPKLKGEKVVIRLASGGQPATGIIESYDPYESLLPDGKRTDPSLQARHCHNRGSK
jgi:hypothetical protein